MRGCTVRHAGPDAQAFLDRMAEAIRTMPPPSRPLPAVRRARRKPGPKRGCQLWTREDWAPFVGPDRTVAEIVAASGAPERTVYNAIRRLRLPHRPALRARDAEIVAMAPRGLSLGQMARRVGMQPSSVCLALKRLGIHAEWKLARDARQAARKARADG